jgi:hypothetical protein
MGATRVKLSSPILNNDIIYLGLPTNFHVFVGNEIYDETLNAAIQDGVFTDEQMSGILAKEGLWSYQIDEEIKAERNEIDNIKVAIYESRFRLNDYQYNKLKLKKKKQALFDLLDVKHSFDYASAEGLASLYRLNYLILCGARNNQFKELGLTLDSIDGSQLNVLKEAYISARLDESTIRELARNEPWRSHWSVSDKNNVFARPLMEWTDEQQSLVIWSKLYDSLREHTEPPPEEVVSDDDAFDGWLILQSRKNKQEVAKKSGEMSISKNKKIREAQEVFIMVGNDKNPMTGENIQLAQDLDDARRLDEILNDDQARAIKRERFATINAVGEIKAQYFGDIQRDLRQRINTMMREKMKGR